MSQIDHLHIALKNSQNLIFYAGETLTGSVHIKVNESFKIRGVKLTVSGCAKVRWTELSGTGKQSKRKTYSATEVYLNHEEMLISRHPDSDLFLSPGEYTFTFKVNLPTMLPTR
jgi:hypothetical protein